MRNYRSFITLLLAGAGCGPLVTEPMPDIPETVEYDTIRIEYGDEDLLGASSTAQALVGDLSPVAGIAKPFVRGTNFIIRAQIRLIDAVTRLRPTAYDSGVWVWDNAEAKQPEERFSRFQIRDLGGGDFAYTWRIGNSADAMLEVFSGQFQPRARFNGRQRGMGILRFNFSNLSQVDPTSTPSSGRVVIAFRSVGGIRQVRVATFDLVDDPEPQPRSIQYNYAQFLDGAGRFRFAAETDFLNDGEPFEEMSIDTVWAPSQAGRALASLTGGSLTPNEVLLHECWDEVGRTTFADATPDLEVPYEDGEQSACDARLLQFTLSPPTLETPQTDPEVPAAHPDEVEESVVSDS